jgi:hypothetical protein
MKILLVVVLFSACLWSLSAAQVEITGINLTTAGLGKTSSRAADTTDVIFVGNYLWIRAWVTGFCDSCVVIAQKSWGGSAASNKWVWSVKDSTVTTRSLAADSSCIALYDSTYVDTKRNHKVPAPFMRWIVASRELNGAGRSQAYANFSNVSVYVSWGK